MIAKALDWIEGRTAPFLKEIDGVTWSNKSLNKVIDVKKIESISFSTLTSLVDYLKSGIDVPNSFIDHIFVNVVSPTRIEVSSGVNGKNYYSRTQIAEVKAVLPEIKIGKWLGQTEFCIMLRSSFLDNSSMLHSLFSSDPDVLKGEDTHRNALIEVASNIVSGTIAEYQDTGISQKATIKTGIQETEDKLLPEKVILRPYRTFLEVEQPKSEFVFRAQNDKYDGVQLSLHEADGGRWKMDAKAAVKAYLEKELSGMEWISVLA